jgi:hypothetical protein
VIVDDSAIFWTVFLGSCVVLTALGTAMWRRPGTAALCVTGIVGIVMLRLSFSNDAFWVLAVILSVVSAFPVTIVTAIVTDNLMDKYGSRED